MHVIFLIGCDIYSYNFANEICASFAKNNFKASFLVFKNETAFNPDKLQTEIKNLIFYERTLFEDVLLPYLHSHSNQGKYVGLEALSKKYNMNYAFCPDIENKHALQFILERVQEWNVDVAITIRCFVKYDKNLINYFVRSNDTYFWNLHPGLLPQYRGIMPVFGAMLNNEIEYGFTLHRVSEKLDNGPIIDSISRNIDYSKSMLSNTLDLIPSGVDLIIKNLMKIIKQQNLPYLIQNEDQKGFYSFPTADELTLFNSKGLCVFTKEEVIRTMQNQYLTDSQKDILNPYL